MSTRKSLLFFMIVFGLPSVLLAQISQPITSTTDKTTPYLNMGIQKETVFQKKSIMQLEKENDSSRNEVVITADYFLNMRASSCLSKMCFGMEPIPVMYFQLDKGRVQVLGATTGSRTVAMVRYMF